MWLPSSSLLRAPRRALGLAAFIGVALLHPIASVEARAQQDIDLVLDDVPLAEAVVEIAKRTGYDYIFEPPLPGRVTVAVPGRVSPEEAGEILHATLQLKGFVAIPLAEHRYKIVRWEKMAGESPFTEDEPDPERARTITTRIELKHASPELIARSLKPLVPGGAQVVSYLPSGSLIFAGSEANVHRLIELAQQLDAAQHEEMMVRRIRYKDASDLKSQLDALSRPGEVRSIFSTEVSIDLDARTNTLIISGSPEQLEKLREWIDLIDVPTHGGGEIQVIPVFYQEPVEFAKLLNELGRVGGRNTGGNELDSGPLTDRDYNVIAHEPTHSLVIRSDRATFEVLAHLIAEMDREPRMVHIETTFYEIRTDGTLGFGAGGIVPVITPKEQDDLGLVFLPNLALSPTGIPGFFEPGETFAGIGGRIFSVVGENVVIPVLDPDGNPVLDAGGNPQLVAAPGLGLSLLAAETSIEVQLTNRPSLLAAVGEESRISIGDEVPIPTASTNIEDLVRLGPSIRVDFNRENVGTEISLTPRYNDGGDIVVDLALELSEVIGFRPNEGPILANRKVEGRFHVAPAHRTIIAGLDSERLGELRVGIPFLSAIPFFGQFFTATVDTHVKDYIVIILAADVVPTQEEKQARDLALAEAVAKRQSEFVDLTGSRYAIRAASYTRREIADASRESLDLEHHPLRIIERESEAGLRFDLYVVGLDKMKDVALAALMLEIEGLDPEIIPLADTLAAAQ